MLGPSIPENDPERLAFLDKLLQKLPGDCEQLGEIVDETSALFDIPIVLVSLVGRDKQCFHAKTGLDVSETSRRVSFCAHAIFGEEIFYIADTLQDLRFHDNPLVTGEPGIRFYAGAPLRPEGFAIGTLCIIDRVPRSFTRSEMEQLSEQARKVEDVLTSYLTP